MCRACTDTPSRCPCDYIDVQSTETCPGYRRWQAEQGQPWPHRVAMRMWKLRQLLHNPDTDKIDVRKEARRKRKQNQLRTARLGRASKTMRPGAADVSTTLLEHVPRNDSDASDHSSDDDGLPLCHPRVGPIVTLWVTPKVYIDPATECYERLRQDAIGEEFHGFLHLPEEIRAMILEYGLARGTVWVPNSITWNGGAQMSTEGVSANAMYTYSGTLRQRYRGLPIRQGRGLYSTPRADKPVEVGLLYAISRQMQQEAENVFWGKNQIVFPAGWWEYPMSVPGVQGPRDYVRLPPARDLSFTFSMDDRSSFDRGMLSASTERAELLEALTDSDRDTDLDDITVHVLRRKRHQRQVMLSISWWRTRCEAIIRLPNMRRLSLDFEDCYCVDGCCRLVERVCNMLRWRGRRCPAVFEITEWKGEEEKEAILRRLADVNGVDRGSIRFLEDQRDA